MRNTFPRFSASDQEHRLLHMAEKPEDNPAATVEKIQTLYGKLSPDAKKKLGEELQLDPETLKTEEGKKAAELVVKAAKESNGFT